MNAPDTMPPIDLLESDPERFRRKAAAARAALAHDPHRPAYHFTPPANWMNDPNGVMQWNGRCHLFYQHHPDGSFWDDMHWGHAVSNDLVHWRDLPIALAPDPGGPDRDGVYSGCAVDDDGVPTLVYTSNQHPDQTVSLAVALDPADPELIRWRKDPGNPVLATYPPGVEVLRTDDGHVHFRDPAVWREGDEWKMLLGSGIPGVGGVVLLYRSLDLRGWEFVGPLLTGDQEQRDPVWLGSMWECPQLFPLGERHVLMVSVWHDKRTFYPACLVGDYGSNRFVPETVHVLDAGSGYAPQSFLDERGQRVLFVWLREQRGSAAQTAAGWSGAMSIPWLLTLGNDATLRFAPPAALAALRREHHHAHDIEIAVGSDWISPDIQGNSLELIAEFAPGLTGASGLIVRRSPGGEEQTRIGHDPVQQVLFVDKSRASLDREAEHTGAEARFALSAGEPLRLHLFVDHSVLEVVANDRVLLTERLYPTRADSLGVGAFAGDAAATLTALDGWEMASAWD